jgi:hypothetical protein
VHRDQKRQQNKVVALRLSQGFCYTSTRQRRETEYHIKNNRDREFDIVLDHDDALAEPEVAARLIRSGSDEPQPVAAKLAAGVRYSVAAGPKSELVLKVIEQRIEQSSMELVSVSKQRESLEIAWLERNLVKTNGPLAMNEGVQQCLAIDRELEATRGEISAAVQETERQAARQERLRQNIKAGGQDELTSRWRSDLDQSEQAIRKIEEESIPALRAQEKELQSRLREALKSLSAEWMEETR